MRVLLIDDIRNVSYVEQTWGVTIDVVARTFQDGIEYLETQGPFDLLILDHDLASYREDGRELTGYDVMVFLEQYPKYLPKRIAFITSNPVGRQRMELLRQRLYKEETE